MFSGPMQDWITNDGNGTTPFVQSRSGWMDLAAYGDVTFWLDVRSVSPPGAGSLTLTYETSPTMDESAFKSLASITLTTSPNPSLTHVALASNPGLGRYVRWKLTGTAAGNWSATFRIFVAAGVGAGGAAWAPTNASVPLLAWYRADTAHDAGAGRVDSWPDQSTSGDANRNQTQATAGLRPTIVTSDAAYGNKPTVQFVDQGVTSVGAWSVGPSNPCTIVIVGHHVGATAQAFLSDSTANMLWTDGTTLYKYNSGVGNGPTAPISNNTPVVIMASDDASGAGDAAKLFVNNLSVPVGTGITEGGAAPTQYGLGTGIALGDIEFTGTMAEVMVFAGILTPTDKANLVTYLNVARAYGIAVT